MERPDRSSLWGGLGLAACSLAIVAGYMSLDDLHYWWSGQTARARVTDFMAVNTRLPEEGANVWYEFANPRNQRLVRTSASVPWSDRAKYPRGREMDIEYIPGEFLKSRMRQTGSRWWPILFALGAAATLGCLITGFVMRRDDEEPSEDEDDEDEYEEDDDEDDTDELRNQAPHKPAPRDKPPPSE